MTLLWQRKTASRAFSGQFLVVDGFGLSRKNVPIADGPTSRIGDPDVKALPVENARGWQGRTLKQIGSNMPIKTATQLRREEIRKELWPKDIAWTGEKPETGWFRAPRTLPLVLMLLSDKGISGSSDLSGVYLELLARHRDSGIVDMVTPGEHSYGAGYSGSRGVRTWQERMRLLEDLGFIKSKESGNQQYKYVLLVHPTIAVQRLYEKGRVPKPWWETYRTRQIETTEATYEKLLMFP